MTVPTTEGRIDAFPSPEDLTSILDAVTDAVTVLDTTGAIVYANEAEATLVGYESVAAFLAATPVERRARIALSDAHGRRVTPEELPGRRLLRGETPDPMEVHVQRVGMPRGYWRSVEARPIRDATGSLRYAVVLSREITTEKQAQAEHRRLHDLIMQAPAGIAYLEGPEHIFRIVNPPFYQPYHRDPTGMTIREARPELAGTGVYELLDQVYETGEPYAANEALRRYPTETGDGEIIRYFNFVYQPTRDVDGNVDGILICSVDVTDHVEGRQKKDALAAALAAERDRLQQVIDVMPEAVIIADAAFGLFWGNRAAAEILGSDTLDVSKPIVAPTQYDRYGIRHVDGSQMPLDEGPLARALFDGETVRGEEMLMRHRQTGADIRLQANSAPLRDMAGAITGAVMVFQDLTAQRDTEAAIAASEQRLRSLVANISDIVNVLGADGTVFYQSGSVERVLGYAADERIGKNIFADPITKPEDMEAKRRFLEEAIAHPGEPVTGAFRLRHKDGTWRDMEALGVNLLGDPYVRGIIATYRDVTVRKRAAERERFLSTASSLLSSSLDYETTLQRVAQLAVPNIADWCVVDILNDDGTIEPVAIVHADPSKVALAREYRRLYPPERDRERHAARVLHTLKAYMVPDITDALIGTSITDPVQLSLLQALEMRSLIVVPLVVHDRAVGRLMLVSSDPSRRYTAEDVAFGEELARRAAIAIDNARLYTAAQASEARYRGLFEDVVDAVLVFDASGNYIDANDAATVLYRESREQLLRRRIGDTPEMREESMRDFERLTREGAFSGEILLHRSDGTTVPIESRTAAIDLPDGTIYVSVLRDITERKRAEEERERLIAMIVHELRNPLASILGYAQLLKRRERYDPKAMAAIITQAQRVDRLTADLHETIKLQSNAYRLKRTTVDVRTFIGSVVEQVQATTTTHRLSVTMPAELPAAEWDTDRISQVLANLLLNAIKYSALADEVRVHVDDAGDHIVIAITDFGIGIPPDALPRVFEPFYRAPNAQAENMKGLGLGLAISREFVEAHGGGIDVISAPGAGSTFTVMLPYQAVSDTHSP